MTAPPFTRVVHADWSVGPRGRWAATATRQPCGWVAEAPIPVPPLAQFVEDLFAAALVGPVLAGFDFPIGLPLAYATRTGLPDFPAALEAFGTGPWASFYAVADEPGEVGLHRPFYPNRPGKALLQHLLDGHGVEHLRALTRRCEQAAPGRRAVGNLFWTLGANQVGKAALRGWREVIAPARRRGAHLWPFDGDLTALAARGGVTLCETYPGDAYGTLGAAFGPRESKRRQADRAGKAGAIAGWAEQHAIALSPDLHDRLHEGFGPEADRGSDRFDAVTGLLATVAVVTGQRAPGAPDDADVVRWEGWILGRPAEA